MLADYDTMCQADLGPSAYEECTFGNLEISHPITLKATFDCGVQANIKEMDDSQSDIAGLDDLMIKKRQKRKEYKKRKKVQKKIMQRQNKEEFKQIIDLFYERQAKFVDYSDRLEELVCSFNQNQFKNIFDSILKQRVVIIQNSIWEYTQAILQENPLEMRHDHPFYLQMVDQIYQYYKLIQKSSFQAQQVIYIYLSLNSKDNDQPITPQDLGRRTFRYLIETDQTLRKLIHMCDKKISYIRVAQRQKLQILISRLKNFRQRFDNNIFDDYNEEQRTNYDSEEYVDSQSQDIHLRYEDEKSTAISQASEEFEQGQGSPVKRKKKRTHINELQSDQQRLYSFLENLNIDHQNRNQCNLQDKFAQRMFNKIERMNSNLKKNTQFDCLRDKLAQLGPLQIISNDFKRLY